MLHSISAPSPPASKAIPSECLRELRELAEQLRAPCSRHRPQLAVTRDDARWQLDALTGQLASAVELAAHTSQSGTREFDRREAARPWTLRLASVFAVLRANLTLDSAAFRHALRLALRGVRRNHRPQHRLASGLLGSHDGRNRAQTDFTTTFSRGVLRLAGTFLDSRSPPSCSRHLASCHRARTIDRDLHVPDALGRPGNYGVLVTP